MNNNETQAPKRRFNAVDFVIILTVIACVVGIVFRYDLLDRFNLGTGNQSAELSLLVQNIDINASDLLKTGDTVLWGSEELGTVKSVSVGKASVYIENEQGQLVLTESENRCDLRCVITIVGKQTDDGFMFNGSQYIAAGKGISIKTSAIRYEALITGIVLVD